jgi:type I restriction enzyme M protein
MEPQCRAARSRLDSKVTWVAMGAIFEELLRKCSEMSNETAGEHYTPREIIALMVQLLIRQRPGCADRPGIGADGVRPRGRHGWHAQDRRGAHPRLNRDARVEVLDRSWNRRRGRSPALT